VVDALKTAMTGTLQTLFGNMTKQELAEVIKETAIDLESNNIGAPVLCLLREVHKRLSTTSRADRLMELLTSHTLDEWVDHSANIEFVLNTLRKCPEATDSAKNRLRALKQDINSLIEVLEAE
jgi:hypothetical protein